VRVRKGVATLSGTVQSRAERRAAARSAEQGGATRVRNRVRVVMPAE